MGERLMKYYNLVAEKKGLVGKMKLAHGTKIPVTAAAMEADSPEKLAAFRKVVESIIGEPPPNY